MSTRWRSITSTKAEGDEAHDACGDPELTLRSRGRALWGSRSGFGSTARFERSDGNIRMGPVNHDKLQLRTCTAEWTVEAWVRYSGPGGRDRVEWGRFDADDALLGRYTYAFLCGTDEEGFSLPSGMRGGWSFYLNCSGVPGTLEDGLMPGSRLLGWSGRMPTHGILITPTSSFGWLEEDRGRFRDTGWHHVAWQFRYRDQMNWLLVDGTDRPAGAAPHPRPVLESHSRQRRRPVRHSLLRWRDPSLSGPGRHIGPGNGQPGRGDRRAAHLERHAVSGNRPDGRHPSRNCRMRQWGFPTRFGWGRTRLPARSPGR